MHMSTTNTTDRARISADVRWQPASEPADPRYVGDVERYLREMSKAGAWNKADEAGGEERLSESMDGASSAGDGANGGGGGEALATPTTQPTPRVTIETLRARWGFPVGHQAVSTA